MAWKFLFGAYQRLLTFILVTQEKKNIRYQRLIAFLQYTGLRYGKFGGHCLIFERVQMQKVHIKFFHELLPSLSAFLFKYDIDKTKGYFLTLTWVSITAPTETRQN